MSDLMRTKMELIRITRKLNTWIRNMHGSHKRRKSKLPTLDKLQDRYLKLNQTVPFDEFFKRLSARMGYSDIEIVDDSLASHHSRTDIVRPESQLS